MIPKSCGLFGLDHVAKLKSFRDQKHLFSNTGGLGCFQIAFNREEACKFKELKYVSKNIA